MNKEKKSLIGRNMKITDKVCENCQVKPPCIKPCSFSKRIGKGLENSTYYICPKCGGKGFRHDSFSGLNIMCSLCDHHGYIDWIKNVIDRGEK